ncbi:hypothetical protein JB92DRAFT_3089462 [Gautieria morchelliformis]|nr:hypothetical protein JB92DRAFT_3089462 [Gautieria morchelliformis]
MSIPFFPYKLFFLYIEPISALGGAIYAGLLPKTYLRDLTLTNNTPTPTAVTWPVLMTLYQLSNLYLLFALNEHLVLSSTDNIKTWKRLLCGLLIADFGHLLSLAPLGFDVYWRVWDWNAMMWGSVGFVYLGATTRMSFLLNLGLGTPVTATSQKAAKAS